MIFGALIQSLLIATVLLMTCIATLHNTIIMNHGFSLKQADILNIYNKPIKCWHFFYFYRLLIYCFIYFFFAYLLFSISPYLSVINNFILKEIKSLATPKLIRANWKSREYARIRPYSGWRWISAQNCLLPWVRGPLCFAYSCYMVAKLMAKVLGPE